MSKTEHETSPPGTLVCPVCKHPLDMSIKKRHKTLGVFVPVWGPDPCQNPECLETLKEREHNSPQND
ncbi:hypothetical protein [Streptomyces sp. NPDC058697]|uniref:hypothetical protein n=1 Tax=Streptomyces sp. NPDC058697 TaxID=3346605 RepID=UPI0036655D3C